MSNFITCFFFLICSGAKESDYTNEEIDFEKENDPKINVANGEYDSDKEKNSESGKELVIGEITFVSCATGSEEPPQLEKDVEVESENENVHSSKQFG